MVEGGAVSTDPSRPDEPTPLVFLKKLFAQTESGRRLLEQAKASCTFQVPSDEATESYDVEIVQAIRQSNIDKLRDLAEHKSLNACNRFGESLLHMACRRGDAKVVQFLLDQPSVTPNTRDDYGRLPVHDAFWTSQPNRPVLDLWLRKTSPELLLSEDVRGHTPFHYSRKEHWEQWVEFLTEREEVILKRIALAAGDSVDPKEDPVKVIKKP